MSLKTLEEQEKEISEIVRKSFESFYGSVYGHGNPPYSVTSEDLDNHFSVRNIEKPECTHEFVDYVGFNDSFKYCKKCDKRG